MLTEMREIEYVKQSQNILRLLFLPGSATNFAQLIHRIEKVLIRLEG